VDRRDIIVIGASAGGSEAIIQLCSSLPEDFPAAVFIVWHLGKESTGYFPKMISKKSKLPAKNADDGEPITPGSIYVAPPGKHMVLEDGIIRTVHGPKENRVRPAIDPLFRSAAFHYGSRVIGMILSGMLNDGTSGLWAIKQRGGIAIVQHPDEAPFPGMPEEAIKNVEVDHILHIKKMGLLLEKLTADKITQEKSSPPERIAFELAAASGKNNNMDDMNKIGELTNYTCPECHGSLWKIKEEKLLRFRCHTGHAYTAKYLIEHLEETLENYIWNAIRGVEENISIFESMIKLYPEGPEREQIKGKIASIEHKKELLNKFLSIA
jgi:two-component system, chemotaxis family, protein-glutamate methylesterase/glutaminase